MKMKKVVVPSTVRALQQPGLFEVELLEGIAIEKKQQ